MKKYIVSSIYGYKNKGTILEPSSTNDNMTNAQITYGYNETIFTDVSSNL